MDETPESSTNRSQPGSENDSAANWFLLAAAVLSLVVTGLLFPMPFHGRNAKAIGDLVHAPLFGSLALGWLWGWQCLRPLDPRAASPSTPPASGPLLRGLLVRGLVVWIVLSGFGAVMEVAQDGMGRSMSRHDAIANALGALAAISGYTGYRLLRMRWWVSAMLFCGLAVAMLVTAWVRPVRMLIDVSRVWRDLPSLASYQNRPCGFGTSRSVLVNGPLVGSADPGPLNPYRCLTRC